MIKWVAYGGGLAIALMLAGLIPILIDQLDAVYQWQPEPSIEDRRHCASAGSMPDCFRTLGYKWERVK